MNCLRLPLVALVLAAVFGSGAALAEPIRIVALGTSLTAGYGLEQDEGLTAQLEAKLLKDGFDVIVENAGVSGDTSAGGRERLDWALTNDPELVIVELGGNDVLRGIMPSETRANLEDILRRLSDRQVSVLVTGMLAPPNLGPDYAAEFNPIYKELAEAYEAALYPFILEGVAAEPALNQPDGIHPNADGVAIMVEGLSDALHPMLAAISETE